ncbi:hypothetical protein KIPB_000511 [Kipferlia bialata]|uniref:EF-hand domain-containing protein n=1 Tax=Kipferlia bialata TaxID=797122 RepID=A0A9K3GEK4_9EUKA|nr:hypothetical protein KIPB_000511 [Kipferlia bialata]|eukprot:g511.t1
MLFVAGSTPIMDCQRLAVRANSLTMLSIVSWCFTWMYWISPFINVCTGIMAVMYISEAMKALAVKYSAVHQALFMSFSPLTSTPLSSTPLTPASNGPYTPYAPHADAPRECVVGAKQGTGTPLYEFERPQHDRLDWFEGLHRDILTRLESFGSLAPASLGVEHTSIALRAFHPDVLTPSMLVASMRCPPDPEASVLGSSVEIGDLSRVPEFKRSEDEMDLLATHPSHGMGTGTGRAGYPVGLAGVLPDHTELVASVNVFELLLEVFGLPAILSHSLFPLLPGHLDAHRSSNGISLPPEEEAKRRRVMEDAMHMLGGLTRRSHSAIGETSDDETDPFDRLLNALDETPSRTEAVRSEQALYGLPSEPESVPVLDWDMLTEYYTAYIHNKDMTSRLFSAVKAPGEKYLYPTDLRRMVMSVVMHHPGLAFLRVTPEFQSKYTNTVVTRLMYQYDREDIGKISLLSMKRSDRQRERQRERGSGSDLDMLGTTAEDREGTDLLSTLWNTMLGQDISSAVRVFSYQHFYVLYCVFWEIDTNHDQKISHDDLLKYANYALSFRCVQRVFEHPRTIYSGMDEGEMSFQGFVWFLMSEEDKDTPQALRYWFEIADIDGDGYIGPHDIKYFFSEQMERLENLGQESVSTEDVLCQMTDMVHTRRNFMCADERFSEPRPQAGLGTTHKKPGSDRSRNAINLYLSQDDIAACLMQGNLFNAMFNLTKFMQFESRDPYTIHWDADSPDKNNWDRFARLTYGILASADEED